MDLGNAVLTLTVDSSQLDTGMKKAKEQTDVLQASVTKLVGAYLGFEGIKKVIALIGSCVNEFIESENAATRLTAALRATDQEYTLTSKRLIEFSESLMKTTVYTHEATEGAAAMLIQLGGLTEAGVRRAIPAVMDLASAMGMDLESAATLVSKALAGNVGALSRYGIQIDKASTPSAQFDAVIQALTGHFGGMSEAMAKTTGGQLKQFTNQIGEAKEAAGGFFATFARGYVQWARDFVEGLRMVGRGLEYVWGFWRDITNLRDPFGPESTNNVRARARAQAELDKEMKIFEEMAYAGIGQMTTSDKAFKDGEETIIKFNESFRNLVNNWVALGRAVQDAGIQAGIEAMTDRWVALGEATAEASAKAAEAMAEEAQAAWDYWTRVAIVADKARYDAEEFAKSEAKLTWDYWTMMSGVGLKATDTALKEMHDKYKSTYRNIMGTVGDAMRGIGNISAQYYRNQYVALDNWYEKQLAALGDMTNATKTQKEQKEALDKEYTAREREIKKKEWQTERGIGIANIIMDTIEAVVSTYKTFGWPWGIIPAAIMTGIGAAQLALYAGQPEPAFARGADFDVPPGYPNDSFPMRVESGEHVSVTPAGAGGEMIRVVVNLDGRPIMDAITRASRDRRVLIDARSVVP